ncbi:MAG TPA: hypothetical protein VFE20_03925 [Thermoleophilia bacterium]|nr:hypothetical protein [Thermoleophilia bacterium]
MIDPRIEPGRDGELSDVGRYRYAVIDNGDVCMEWGSLSREGRTRE